MKNLAFDLGGRPFNNDDLVTLQQELTAAVQAQFLGKGPFILNGCVVSGTGPSYNITAGIVCLDGQLLRFAGAGSVTLPAQLQAGSAVLSDPRPYQTGRTRDCMREVPAELVPSDPTYTLGDFLPLDTWGGKRWEHVQRTSVRYLGEIAPLASAAYVPADYDATGLGKPGSPAWGWALCNGINGTDDIRGRSIAAFSELDGDYVVGATHGNKTTTIDRTNLPANPPGTKDVATFVGGNTGGNLTPSVGNGWAGQPPLAGAGIPLDTRSPYIALPMRQWVGYGA